MAPPARRQKSAGCSAINRCHASVFSFCSKCLLPPAPRAKCRRGSNSKSAPGQNNSTPRRNFHRSLPSIRDLPASGNCAHAQPPRGRETDIVRTRSKNSGLRNCDTSTTNRFLRNSARHQSATMTRMGDTADRQRSPTSRKERRSMSKHSRQT